MSHENLSILSQEARSRMSNYELAERATIERAKQYNTLGIEPLPVRGGTLHVVTSGIVVPQPESFPTIEMSIEDGEIVRRQVSSSPLTVFADAVELRPPTRLRRGQALLYRLEQPLDPVLASTRGSFRSTVTRAMDPDKASGRLPNVRFEGGAEAVYYDRQQREEQDETEVRFVSNGLSYRRVPLSYDARSRVHLEQMEGQQQGEGIGVRFSLCGLVRSTLEPYDLARIDDNRVLAGPPEQTSVEFELPPDTPQRMSVRIVGGGSAAYAHLQSSLDAETMAGLLPDDAIDWVDVTDSFLSSLTASIAEQLPLDAVGSYDQTVARAREQIRGTLLTGRKQLIQSTGCLAITAELPELPSTIEGMLFERRAFERVN